MKDRTELKTKQMNWPATCNDRLTLKWQLTTELKRCS